ncbi:hypothetical protein [Streptomyces sp. NPDC001978]|uniref:hypothetical protein n=1 Tax=Streptomyces sp. NPDC001978 TaxID=3364627 RepID=UPI0036A4520E
MSLVTILAVYPFALLYDGLIAEHFHSWPLHWRTANFPIFLAPLLTYAVMPWLSRVLRRTRRRGPGRSAAPTGLTAGPHDAPTQARRQAFGYHR